jgi:peptidyl-prolyl cis-trans isomerase A (cyclophilin A)
MKTTSLLFAAVLMLVTTAASAQGSAPRVSIETTHGRIVLELAPKEAPKTVDNFLAYVKAGHYDGTVFHRVIPTFMIQGGGYSADLTERRGDPNSATAQFFINVVDNPRLDYPSFDGNGYAVFGKVVEGMDVVDKIRDVPTASRGGHQNVPETPVTIKSARIVK